MSTLRRITFILLALVLVAFGYTYIGEWMDRDSSAPVISFDTDQIHVGLEGDEDLLLQGVTAYDEKDGDLTGKLYVESVSKFISPGVSNVVYAVCDSNNHVTTAQRLVVYDGYESPRFALSQNLIYRTSATIRVRDRLTVNDVLEGDLSQKIVLGTSDMNTSREGGYHISAKVTNSKGDEVELNLPVLIENSVGGAPEIKLTEYLTYLDVGQTLDPMAYVLSVSEGFSSSDIRVEGLHQFNEPGVVMVDYYLTDEHNRTGHQVLIVVVGDGKGA